MTLVAEFTIPAEALPFGETLASLSDARIELDRVVPTNESVLPFFWVVGTDADSFLERADAEADVDDVTCLERIDDRALFRAHWSPRSELIQGIRHLDGTIVESVATSEQWRFEVRAQERASFARFQAVFQAHDVPVQLHRLADLSELADENQRPLTADQRETLVTAYRAGYFEKPRETTQEELGEAFGVSSRAVSDRLRRGTRNLIAATVLPDGKRT